MAAPPHQDPSRLGKGPSGRPIPSGTGAFVVTPSTSPNAVWTSSPAVAGSVQKGNPPALTASAGANQSMGRSLKHPGLGSTIIRDRSSAVTSISPVSAVVPDRDGPRPSLRADLDRLRAGSNPILPVEQSPDSRHYTRVSIPDAFLYLARHEGGLDYRTPPPRCSARIAFDSLV